jgi:Asp-tRNA(Asn)/Glu-tRNA(Gln) amidotransferase C subunit
MTSEAKIKQLLESIKLEIDDIKEFENDVDSILKMFDQLKKADVREGDSQLHKKRVDITSLREDEALDSNFRPEMRGNYFKVPNVSKRKN